MRISLKLNLVTASIVQTGSHCKIFRNTIRNNLLYVVGSEATHFEVDKRPFHSLIDMASSGKFCQIW